MSIYDAAHATALLLGTECELQAHQVAEARSREQCIQPLWISWYEVLEAGSHVYWDEQVP